MARNEGRAHDETRKVKVVKNFIKYPAGSVLIQMGNTKVSCSATVENKVPPIFTRQENRVGHGGILHDAKLHPHPNHP